MVGFAQQLQTEVTPVASPTTPSAFTGLFTAISAFQTEEISLEEQKKKAGLIYFDKLEAARQAKEQGNSNAANSIATSAYREYYSQYGAGDESINTSFQNFTGVPVGVSVGDGAVDMSSVFSSEEYNTEASILQAANPTASQADIAAQAAQNVIKTKANAAQLEKIKQQEKVEWVSAKPVYEEKVKLLGEKFNQLIITAQGDDILTAEEAQEIRKMYQAELGYLPKPSGVSDEDWKSFNETSLSAVKSVIESTIGLGEKYGIRQDQARQLQQIMTKAISKDLLPTSVQYALSQVDNSDFSSVLDILKTIEEDPKYLDNINLFKTGNLSELMDLVTDFEDKTPETFFARPSSVSGAKSDLLMEEYKQSSPSSKVAQLESSFASIGTGEGSAGTNAVYIDDLLEKVNLLEGSALQPEQLSKFFGQKFFNALNGIEAKNPEIAAALISKTVDVTTTQVSNAYAALNSEASQFGLALSKGFVTIDLTNGRAKAGQNYVDKYFDGSWEKARAAKGIPDGVVPVYTEFQNYNLMANRIILTEQRMGKIASLEKQLSSLETRLPKSAGSENQPQDRMTDFELSFKLPEEVSNDKEFMSKVGVISQDFGFNPNDLLRVIEFETAKSWSPKIKSPNSTATGLIQFLESTAKGLGTSTAELAKMSRAEQMDYVAKYLAPYKGKLKNFGDIYMAVHWPAGIGKDETYVMYEKGSKEYDANKNLDTNGDGTVTRGETIASVIARTGNGKMTTPFTQEAQTFVEETKADVSSALPSTAQKTRGASTAPTPTAEVTATLPEQAATEAPVAPVAPVVADQAVSQDAQSLLAMVGGRVDKSYFSEEEFQAATVAGELEAGDIVYVNGDIFIIRKDGSAQKVGG